MAEPPTIDELAAFLRDYFVGSKPEDAARLHAALTAVYADKERVYAISSHMRVQPDITRGQAWKEEMDPPGSSFRLAIAGWIAATVAGYPKPRPYCPARYCGTWRQVSPDRELTLRERANLRLREEDVIPPRRDPPFRWRLHADGTFACEEPWIGRHKCWCVHLGSDRWMDTIYLGERRAAVLLVRALDEECLWVQELDIDRNTPIEYVLNRAND